MESMNNEKTGGVFTFAEQVDGELSKVSLELVGKARELAGGLGTSVTAILPCAEMGNMARELVESGADRVIVIAHPSLGDYATEPYAHAVASVIRREHPEILLYGATSIGRDLAPRISARVRTGLTADCTSLEIDPETKALRMTRPAFGGNLMATIVSPNHRPQMATVRPGVMQALAPEKGRAGTIETFDPGFTKGALDVEILEIVRRAADTSDIGSADIIVAGGRGVGSREKFALLEELAGVLGGTVAASRPCVEAGWVEPSRQVGQTGRTVRPKVYFAIGISGAIQHLAGMEGSGLIIAVNNDETAPIFSVADLGIVGDLNEVIPRLIQKVRAAKAG